MPYRYKWLIIFYTEIAKWIYKVSRLSPRNNINTNFNSTIKMPPITTKIPSSSACPNVCRFTGSVLHGKAVSNSRPRGYGEFECFSENTRRARILIILAYVSKGILDIPTKPKEPVCQEIPTAFTYDGFYNSVLRRKKEDKSYRYFRNINRIAKEFPVAHSADERKRVNVWCSNDYVSLQALYDKGTNL